MLKAYLFLPVFRCQFNKDIKMTYVFLNFMIPVKCINFKTG